MHLNKLTPVHKLYDTSLLYKIIQTRNILNKNFQSNFDLGLKCQKRLFKYRFNLDIIYPDCNKNFEDDPIIPPIISRTQKIITNCS